MFLSSLSLGLLLSSSLVYSLPTGATASSTTPSPLRPHNDFSCRSTENPNPVVLLHGLGATYYEDLNYLEAWLQIQGHCTFSITYGAYDGFPFVGGLKPINESAQQIASFIREVQTKTGADKVDIVGHSEGAFQSLYVPKFTGVSPIIDKIVAIAPPTHGTTFANLWDLAYLLGNGTREAVGDVLRTFGCAACDDLSVGGAAIAKLNDGTPILQPGNQLTVIASKSDELVTPAGTSSWVEEDGVTNEFVQKTCSFDPVGHIGEAYDLNVWNLVKNALEGTPNRVFTCFIGSPGKI